MSTETPAEALEHLPTTVDTLTALIARAEAREQALGHLAADAKGVIEKARLEGKREGAALIRSFAEEAIRDNAVRVTIAREQLQKLSRLHRAGDHQWEIGYLDDEGILRFRNLMEESET